MLVFLQVLEVLSTWATPPPGGNSLEPHLPKGMLEPGTVSLQPLAQTVLFENFRDHCSNGETEAHRGKGLKTELGDILLPPMLFPLPPILFLLPVLWACTNSSALFCINSQPRPASLLTLAFIPTPQGHSDCLPTGPFAPSTPLQPGDLPEVQVRPHFFPARTHHGSPDLEGPCTAAPPPSGSFLTLAQLSSNTQELQKSYVP